MAAKIATEVGLLIQERLSASCQPSVLILQARLVLPNLRIGDFCPPVEPSRAQYL